MKWSSADRCEATRAALPALAVGELSWWRRRLVERHVARCDGCTEELARQRHLADRLSELSEAVSASAAGAAPVPDDLLDSLLDRARDPGMRGRAAVPARGAISGARPELTAAFGITILAMLAAALWAGWRLGRAWTRARADR